jgi:hypothetical protein
MEGLQGWGAENDRLYQRLQRGKGAAPSPEPCSFDLICEEADASIEYGELSFLEVLATIRAMRNEFKTIRVLEGEIT